MDYKIKLEKFEGPLDLLLQLVLKNKLEITELSLAEVTLQYVDYIEKLEQINPDELSDFLVIAARLLLIKSKAILPEFESGDEELDDLQNQLKIFQEFYEAAKTLNEILQLKNYAYSRPKIITKKDIVFSPPENFSAENLKNIFLQAVTKVEAIVNIPQATVKKTMSLQEKILHLRDLVAKAKNFSFSDLIKDSKDKTEVIVSFLALLELIKERSLKIEQKGAFREILVKSGTTRL